ncbi:MAG: hypothetical protein OEZ47_17730, partial [Gammaproteobacteria bacterium]|nr:hypothetical protein [Gammaproteobacteria bacterium]
MDLFSRTPKAPISIIFCLIISFLVTTASAAPGLEWDSEIVYDPIYFRIGQQSLLYDASNTPHVFFGADNLYHSSYDGEKWVRETVDTNPRVGGNVAATMDSEGYFHIVYDDSASQDIDRTYYATNRSGSWVIETLPPEIRARWIAVDSKNKAHLVSTSKDNKLYSVAKTDSNWKSTHLSDRVGFLSSSSTLPEVSMTVDSNDIVHILYSRRSEDGVTTNDNEVVHTFGTGEQWSEEIIQKSEGHFTNYHYNSITVDINNKLHLVFAGAGSLNYATNKTGDWITETVDPEGYYEKYPSIEVDDSGTIYISYLNQLSSYPNLQLKLLTKTTDGWSTEVLDEGYVWGVNTDLALDINQRIHVVTYHSDSSSIHLFSQNDRIWSKEVVEKSNEPEGGIGNIESLPATGMYPSIAYDSDNSTYVAYFRSGDITHS